MKRLTLIVLFLMVATTVACSSDLRTYSSAKAIAAALECTQLETNDAERVMEAGVCELDGERVSIFVFEDASERDAWLNFGERFSNDLITGPNWAVDPPQGSDDELRAAL